MGGHFWTPISPVRGSIFHADSHRNGLSSIGDLSLRVGVKWSKLEVAIFAQNLTDQDVQLLKYEQGSTIYAFRYNQPRTEGVNLIYRW
jgi:hypothetical protein